jgi:putative hemolysin
MNDNVSITRTEPLDIRKVFRSKSPKIARIIPDFIYRYLDRIVHVDELNKILKDHGEKVDAEFIKATIEYFNVKIDVEGKENIPASGRYIFASNHPLGGFDGILLMNIVSHYYAGFKFLVNDLLMNLTNIRGLFVPINKHGSLGLQSAVLIENALRSDNQILTFPAGLVSRKINGRILDLPWKKSFILQSITYKRDIIPVHFSGSNSNFFYKLANFRKFIGIRANIEMFYLVDETFQHRNKHFTVKFGSPIPWQTFDKSKSPVKWAKWVKERAYELDDVHDIPL